MSAALYPAMIFTVALMVTTAYFILGGLPLLTLKHDVPLDATFTASFVELGYRMATWTALGAACSYLAWGRGPFALGACVLAAASALLRRRVPAVLRRLGGAIAAGEPGAIARFKRLHGAVLLGHGLQLAAVVAALVRLSLQITR